MTVCRLTEPANVFVFSILIFVFCVDAAAIDFNRDFSTDRPDKTESPFTVERGGSHVELSLLDGLRTDSKIGEDTYHYREAFVETLVKYGFAKSLDVRLQSGYEGYSSWLDGNIGTSGKSEFPSFD